MNSNSLKCKVVMLPCTQKATQQKVIWLTNIDNNKLLYEPMDSEWMDMYKPQHLYLVSNREIKEGDWYLDQENNLRRKSIETSHKGDKKIEASTDTFISFYTHNPECISQTPQIGEDFIKAYIKAYNEGKPIVDVEIEMRVTGSEYFKDNSKFSDECVLEIKTRSDNTVIIHKTKEFYTREEVQELINSFAEAHDLSITDSRTHKWIEQNL